MASHRQRKQPSYPSPSVLRSGSRFHKAESLSSEASSPVGRRQKSVDSHSYCGYYAPNESEFEFGLEDAFQSLRELMNPPRVNESIGATASYAYKFPSLNDSVQKRSSAALDTQVVSPSEGLTARDQAAKSKKRSKNPKKSSVQSSSVKPVTEKSLEATSPPLTPSDGASAQGPALAAKKRKISLLK